MTLSVEIGLDVSGSHPELWELKKINTEDLDAEKEPKMIERDESSENNTKKPSKVSIIFTPSGKRGDVEYGTTILDAARQLNVDLDSVCGGRAMCGRCQVQPTFGKFAKHQITSLQNNLSPPSNAELYYREKKNLKIQNKKRIHQYHGEFLVA